MAAIASLAVALTAQIDGFVRGLNTAEEHLRGFTGRVEGAFKDIGKGLGASSGIGRLGQVLAGGGALAGITLVTRALDQAAERAQGLADALRAGEAGAEEVLTAAVGMVPVYGQVWATGRKIHRSFWDTAAAVAEWAGASNETVASLESVETHLARITEQHQVLDQVMASAEKTANAARLIGLSAEERELELMRQKHAEQLKSLSTAERAVAAMTDPNIRAAAELGLRRWREELAALTPEAQQAAEAQRAAAEKAAAAAVRTAETIADIRQRIHERIIRATAGPAELLRRQLEGLGESPTNVAFIMQSNRIADLAEHGASAIAGLTSELDKLRGIDPLDKLLADLEAAAPASQRLAEMLAKVRDLRATLDIETKLAGLGKERQALLDQLTERGGATSIGALTRGSVEAFSAERGNMQGFRALERLQQEAIRLDRERNTLLREQASRGPQINVVTI